MMRGSSVRPTLFIVVGVDALGEVLQVHLDRVSQFAVVGRETDGASALLAISQLDRPPDILLLEAQASGALEAAREMQACDGTPRMVVLGVDESPSAALAWAGVGAVGLLARMARLDELLSTLEGVAGGEAPCSPGVAAALVRGVAKLADPEPLQQSRVSLTAREHEVALLLGDGLTNGDIATRLQIEVGTVKSHVHSVLHKLGVSRRAQVPACITQSDLAAPPFDRFTTAVRRKI